MESIKNLLQSLLQTPTMGDVRGHVAKMNDQKYHVYFTAANPNGDYRKASEIFKRKFNEGEFDDVKFVVSDAYLGKVKKGCHAVRSG